MRRRRGGGGGYAEAAPPGAPPPPTHTRNIVLWTACTWHWGTWALRAPSCHVRPGRRAPRHVRPRPRGRGGGGWTARELGGRLPGTQANSSVLSQSLRAALSGLGVGNPWQAPLTSRQTQAHRARRRRLYMCPTMSHKTAAPCHFPSPHHWSCTETVCGTLSQLSRT